MCSSDLFQTDDEGSIPFTRSIRLRLPPAAASFGGSRQRKWLAVQIVRAQACCDAAFARRLTLNEVQHQGRVWSCPVVTERHLSQRRAYAKLLVMLVFLQSLESGCALRHAVKKNVVTSGSDWAMSTPMDWAGSCPRGV